MNINNITYTLDQTPQILSSSGGGDSPAETYGPINFLLFFIVTWIYVFLGGYMEHKHVTFIHITGLGIIIGFFIGMIFHFASGGDHQYSNLDFDEHFFFHVILPPIIFAGGYNLQTRRFFYCFLYILLFGLLATIINFGITTGFTHMFNELRIIEITGTNHVVTLQTTDILLYSATVCSTDAIAALTMIDSSKYPKLFSVIFGEGMLNDAVSIIIYLTVFNEIVDKDDHTEFKWHNGLQIIGQFFLIIFSSIAIGLVFGIISALITKFCRFLQENPMIEVTTIFLLGYIPYLICEALHFSGVIAILVCAVVMNHYSSQNLSITGKISSKVSLEFLSMCAEGFLYMYLGISSWHYQGPFKSAHPEYTRPWSWQFVILALITTFIARFVGIFIISWIILGIQKWRGKRTFILNRWELSIIYFSGLIRGAIAYALVQTVPGTGLSQEVVKATVFFLVVITTLGMGSFIPFWIKFSLKKIQESPRYTQDHPSIFDPLSMEKVDRTVSQAQRHENNVKTMNQTTKKIENWFSHMDRTYILPFLVYEYEQNKEILEKEEEIIYQVTQRSASHFGGDRVERTKSAMEQFRRQLTMQSSNNSSNCTDKSDQRTNSAIQNFYQYYQQEEDQQKGSNKQMQDQNSISIDKEKQENKNLTFETNELKERQSELIEPLNDQHGQNQDIELSIQNSQKENIASPNNHDDQNIVQKNEEEKKYDKDKQQ